MVRPERDNTGMDGWLLLGAVTQPRIAALTETLDCGNAFIPVPCRNPQHKLQQRFRKICGQRKRLQNGRQRTTAKLRRLTAKMQRNALPRQGIFENLSDTEQIGSMRKRVHFR